MHFWTSPASLLIKNSILASSTSRRALSLLPRSCVGSLPVQHQALAPRPHPLAFRSFSSSAQASALISSSDRLVNSHNDLNSEPTDMSAAPTLSFTDKQVLTKEDGPLVWIDCEMTGLDLSSDRLLEIAVIITNGNLEAVDEGVQFVIKTDKEVLDNMGEWCVDMHGKTGLTQACIESPLSHAEVEAKVLEYIKTRVPDQRLAVLAGNTVHADLAFLKLEEGRGMKSVVDWLHYRIVDVSSIKELSVRWFPNLQKQLKEDRCRAQAENFNAHRAMDDIKQSIYELQSYRQHLFRESDDIKRTKRERAEEREGKEREAKRVELESQTGDVSVQVVPEPTV